SGTSLENLSPEISHMICTNLQISDIENLRLVNKYWSEIGGEHLCFEIYVFFNRKSFERLLAISQHPLIRKSIRTIFYEPLQL
ncbi:hypothetical protein EJ08DRAFT_556494, partial [Tothia fuscella]